MRHPVDRKTVARAPRRPARRAAFLTFLGATAAAPTAMPPRVVAAQGEPATQAVIRPGHEGDISEAVRDFLEPTQPACRATAIRVEATRIAADLTCGDVPYSLFVTAREPTGEEASAAVVRSASGLWARLAPAPTGAAAPLEDRLRPLLEGMPSHLFVEAEVSEDGSAAPAAPALLRRVALGGLLVVFLFLAVWSRRKATSEPAP